ncbi:MAG: LemA family protein [Candidatus Diapherotrites archaeon]|uniref:LemA family protein n=1 Tax=Candidatus Iainarchaeum sp. TaxID=3101447 RepID=A0A8T3YNS0_9ARCH|nr:LemA family protein [Candidatus Diapherotrites archaeon]
MGLVETIGLLIIGIIAIAVIWLVLAYNGFVTLRNRIENSWSQIDVQLKRRYDLVPNLIETVKGYTKHEKETLKMVTEARAAITKAGSPKEKMAAENMLSGALKSLFAVSEAYPDLKANQNFLMLQEELSGIESKLAYTRQFYNDTVLAFNTKVETLPDSIIASAFGFRKNEYFRIEEAARENVKVQF